MLANRFFVLSDPKRSLISIQCYCLMQNHLLFHSISDPFYIYHSNYSYRTLLSTLPYTVQKSYFSRVALNLSSLKSSKYVQQTLSTEPATSVTPKPPSLSDSEVSSSYPSSPVPASLRRNVDEYFIQYQPTRVSEETVTFDEASRVLTVPNALSFARLLSGPLVGYLIFTAQLQIAAPLFLFAAITDWLDGKIAEYWPSQRSALGSALDPLADKVLIGCTAVMLAMVDALPVTLAALFVAKDVALVLFSARVRYRVLPEPKRLSDLLRPSVAPVQIQPIVISKVNTALQSVLLVASFAVPVWDLADSPLLLALWGVTALSTVSTGFSYWRRLRGANWERTWRVLRVSPPAN